MKHFGHQNHNQGGDFSPLRQNYSLSVEDIAGAKPKQRLATKKTQHYEDKLANDNSPFLARQQLHEKLYVSGNYHEGGLNLATQKKHYHAHHTSEIAQHNLMQRRENEGSSPHLNQVDFPRNLATDDIPGAKAGTLQSKTVKNHDLANKIRAGQFIEDSLDRFQQQKRSESPSPYIYGNDHYSSPALRENYHQPRSQSINPGKKVTYEDARQRASVNALEAVHRQPFSRERGERASVPANYEAYSLYNQHASAENQYQAPSQNNIHYEPRSAENYPRQQVEAYQPPVERQQPEPVNYESYAPRQNESYQAPPRQNESYKNDYNNQREEPQLPPQQQPSPVKYMTKGHAPIKADDLIKHQGALEKKYFDNLKGRTFNIISGYPSASMYTNLPKKSYGSSLNAMAKNVEGYRKAEQMKSWNPYEQNLNNTNQTVDGVGRREIDSLGFAGKLNDYSNTNIRYGNPPRDQAPLDPSQLYGTRALKNLSGVGF